MGTEHTKKKAIAIINLIKEVVEANEDGNIDFKEKIEIGITSILLAKNWNKVFVEIKDLTQFEMEQLKFSVEQELTKDSDFDDTLVGSLTESVFNWFGATLNLYIVGKECFSSK